MEQVKAYPVREECGRALCNAHTTPHHTTPTTIPFAEALTPALTLQSVQPAHPMGVCCSDLAPPPTCSDPDSKGVLTNSDTHTPTHPHTHTPTHPHTPQTHAHTHRCTQSQQSVHHVTTMYRLPALLQRLEHFLLFGMTFQRSLRREESEVRIGCVCNSANLQRERH